MGGCLMEQLAAVELDYKVPPSDNPMKGLVPYSASAKSDRFPHSLEFNYVSLKQI